MDDRDRIGGRGRIGHYVLGFVWGVVVIGMGKPNPRDSTVFLSIRINVYGHYGLEIDSRTND